MGLEFAHRPVQGLLRHSNFFNNTCTQKLTANSPLGISLAGLGALRRPRPGGQSQLGPYR